MIKMKRNPAYYLAASVSLLTFAVYLSSLQNEFVNWDDGTYIVDNPFIHSLNGALLKWAFFDFYASNWHPLTWISHALDYAVWGLNPLGHHLTNNILHAANTFLVVLLVAKLMEAVSRGEAVPRPKIGRFTESPLQKNDPRRAEPVPTCSGLAGMTNQFSLSTDTKAVLIAALTTGLLFGLHPIHVESVAWVAERKDLLCALFFLLSIMMYTQYLTPPSPYENHNSPLFPSYLKRGRGGAEGRYFRKGWRSRGSYLLSFAFFTLALLSKPMAVSLPFVLLILDWYPFRRITSYKTFGTAFIEKIPFIALSLVSSILTVQAQNEAIVPMELVPLSQRILVGVDSLVGYLWKMILPVNLSPFYPYPKNLSPFLLEYFLALVLVTGLTVACLILAKKQKLWLSAWGYYAITLIPVLGVVQVGSQSMADRYTYLPSLGPFLIMGLVMAWVSQKADILNRSLQGLKILSIAAAISVPLCLSYLTVQQIGVWKNAIELWSYVIEHEPMKVPVAYYNRGIAFDRAGQFNKAIEDYDKAIALFPSHFEAYNNRGMAFEKIDQLNRALEDFGSAIAVNPSYYQAYYNRAIIFERIGQYDRAIEDYDRTIALNPSYSEAYNNRGIVFDNMGRYNNAIEDYNKTIALNPSHFEAYYNLGTIYGKTALFEKAVEAFNRAIAINPNYPYAYSNRGLAYSHLGQYESALNDLNRALALDYNYAKAYVDRGNLYLKTGNKEFAVPDFQKACDLGNKGGCSALQSVSIEK
jgi:tetratricopeptide (TPR) repeat protein